jgi:sulfonate transport system substrate-binding protein
MQMTAEETGLELEAVEEMYNLYDFRMDITDDDLAALENTEEFMLANGLIEDEVDVSALLLEK